MGEVVLTSDVVVAIVDVVGISMEEELLEVVGISSTWLDVAFADGRLLIDRTSLVLHSPQKES